ncbi:MAG: SRPBCC family protein [Burkholderiales bacterium]|nr:SRPBCC family protein [Burkholderiales bacterium]
MVWIKRLLMSLVAVLAVAALGGMLLPREYHVERHIQITAAPHKVFALVAEPAQWKRWTVWNRRDPAMAISYFGPASGAGAGWEWRSTSQGDGRMTLTQVEPPVRVRYDLYFPDWDDTTQGELRFEPRDGGTRVSWLMDGRMGANPLMRWMGLLMDRLVGPDFEAGLNQLKPLAEAS